MPKRAVFERSCRELSLDISVGVHILLVVEQSNLESQSRGCAKTPICTGTYIHTQNSTFTVDEGNGRLNPSREKNSGKHRKSKVEKSFATFLMCDPGWCVHTSDVQHKWDDKTHTYMQETAQDL